MKQLTHKEYEEKHIKQNLRQREYYYRMQKIKIEKVNAIAEKLVIKLKGKSNSDEQQ